MKKAGLSRLYHIPVLSKTLDILEFLQNHQPSASLEELYQRTRFSKTTIYRILRTLEHRGYLAHHEDGRYRLISRPSKLRFGFAAQSDKLPFSQAVTASLKAAAAASGVELLILDNRYDAATALRNVEQFILERVDLVIEFQVDQDVAPILSDKLYTARIPLIAVEIPHPHAIFLGVDNFRVGFITGEFLGHYAKRRWRSKVDRVLGLDIEEAGNLVQGRITGAFEAIREVLPELPSERFLRVDGRGLLDRSYQLTRKFLESHPLDRHLLIVAADDTSALGAVRAVREAKRQSQVAIAGHDGIPEALEEIKTPGSPLQATITHEVDTYGPRLMQIGLALVRGQQVAPYHHVGHKLVTGESLAVSTETKG